MLHNLGIFHCDLHSGNIVLDPINNDVRIIDYGRTMWIRDIYQNDIPKIITFWLGELDITPITTKNSVDIIDLLNFEYIMYLRYL